MAEFDLLAFIQQNISTIASSTQFVAGAVVGAMFLRKKNRIETGTQEFEKIKAGLIKEAAEELLNAGKISLYEFCKMDNYLEIAKKADEYRKTDTIPPQSFGWHTRFYEDSGNISDEKLQDIWAKVLAGEIDHPGSCSLRTLDCLRNISKEEAELFQKVCDASIRVGKSVLLPRFGGVMEDKGITYDDVLRLDDCGLMKSASGMVVGMPIGESYGIVTYDDKWVLLAKKRQGANSFRLELPQYLFSACGSELYGVVGTETDIPKLCEMIKGEFNNYEFACGQVVNNDNGKITYTVITLEVHREDTTEGLKG